jgi:8-oxo-dGTP pyrophosphatase MutT (NUDIX family)
MTSSSTRRGVSRRTRPSATPLPPTKAILRRVSSYDPALRDRVRGHLAQFERHTHARDELRAAAVALALLPDTDGAPAFVLTRRAAKLKAHQGQWALPGGRIDAGESPSDAALRELREEVGLDLGGEAVLGLLDDYPTRSGYCITPVVVWAGAEAELAPNPDEVAVAYRVALAELDRPDVPRLRTIPESDRPVISIPLLGTHIHAPTAAILFQLREVALRGLDSRVAHYEQPVFAWR